jgi:predicted permease
MVGLVLLIACANVGHLVLARSATRRAEFALRLAIGASRARVMRQVLVEGLVLAGLGAVGGVALAWWIAPALVAYATVGHSSVMLDLSPDLRVLAFTTLVSIAAGLLFASAPAIRAAHVDRSAASGRDLGRVRHAGADHGPGRTLVVAQVALSVVLLVGAGLFVRTLQNLHRQETGVALDRIVVVRLEPRGSSQRTEATAPQLDRVYRDVLARVERIPGVRSASLARSSPLESTNLGFPVATSAAGDPQRLRSTIVYPRYFETMGIPVVKGRDFADDDLRANAPPAVIVNESFVREILHDREAIGEGHGVRIGIPVAWRKPGQPSIGPPLNIIGIVRDSPVPGLRGATPPTVYQGFLQASTGFGHMVLHVRAARDSAEIIGPVIDLVRAIEREVPMDAVRTLASDVDVVLVRERLVATLSSVFGLVALALICIGLYGLMAFTVSRRTSEIGVRMALGATPSSARWLIARQALTIVLAGLAIGIPTAWIGGRLASRQLSTLLYDVTSTDPLTTAVAVTVLVAVAMVAGLLPARRAARIDPVAALRSE